MIDIVGTFKEIIGLIFDIIILFFKIPAMIWFRYVPAPMRIFTYCCIIALSVYMIYWMYKHRYDWLHVYNY